MKLNEGKLFDSTKISPFFKRFEVNLIIYNFVWLRFCEKTAKKLIKDCC